MKLRIHGNSLRLRLGPGDVKRLHSQGLLEESISIGGQRLGYAIRSDASATRTHATLADSRITVVVPLATIGRWATSDEVGIEGHDGPVSILIEKDFECLHPTSDEPRSETFPNPRGQR